jgi:hypothetical protein
MARASTKEPETEAPPEDPPEETPPEEPEGEGLTDSLRSFIEETVEKAIDKLKPSETSAGRRPTYRDEEESMSDLVVSKVEELLHKERKAKENHPEPTADKAPPEPVPAQPEGRRVEKIMGWN